MARSTESGKGKNASEAFSRTGRAGPRATCSYAAVAQLDELLGLSLDDEAGIDVDLRQCR